MEKNVHSDWYVEACSLEKYGCQTCAACHEICLFQEEVTVPAVPKMTATLQNAWGEFRSGGGKKENVAILRWMTRKQQLQW